MVPRKLTRWPKSWARTCNSPAASDRITVRRTETDRLQNACCIRRSGGLHRGALRVPVPLESHTLLQPHLQETQKNGD